MKKLITTCVGALLLSTLYCSMASNTTSTVNSNVSGTPPGTISFVGDAGSPNTFVFNSWKFTEAAIPDGDVEKIKVGVEIEVASMSTASKDLEQSIRKKENYFYAKKFPKAMINIDGAKKISDTEYQTDAMLSLKGIEKPVTLTFTIDGNHVVGGGTLMRREFQFTGDGPKEEVPITFDVNLPL